MCNNTLEVAMMVIYLSGDLFLIINSVITTLDAQPACKFPVCPRRCLYGQLFEKDQERCDVCKCARRPKCPKRPECVKTTKCETGIKRIDGCMSPTCECNNETCSPLTCTARRCPLGFAKDSVGFACPTCECRRRRRSVACRPLPCLALLDCAAGARTVKVRGCPVCLCGRIPTRCPKLSCDDEICQHGNVFVRGCMTCECRPASVTCPTIQCNRKSCRFGFARSKTGCPTCRCNRQSRRRGGFRRRN